MDCLIYNDGKMKFVFTSRFYIIAVHTHICISVACKRADPMSMIIPRSALLAGRTEDHVEQTEMKLYSRPVLEDI